MICDHCRQEADNMFLDLYEDTPIGWVLIGRFCIYCYEHSNVIKGKLYAERSMEKNLKPDEN
jgi:hypothetical protein